MSYDVNYTGSTDNTAEYAAWLMMLFGQARTRRLTFEVQWEESAAVCWPEYRNSFSFGHVRPPGVKYTEFQVDTSGSVAAHRFMSICDALITPFSMLWSVYKDANPELMKDREVQLYYKKYTQAIWSQRYRWEANFVGSNQLNWHSLGVFGNMGMMVEELDTRPGNMKPGLRYIATSPGEMYPLRNYQGRVTGFIRHFRWNASQAILKWGMENVAVAVKAAYDRNDQTLFDFLQFVLPNTEYDPHKIFSWQGKPWASVYLSVFGMKIMERGGYRSFPWAGGAYDFAPEEDYGRGPGQMVLPSLKTLNAEKAMMLRVDHKAAEPAYLISDDGLVTLKTAPSAFNYGGLGDAGEPRAKPLETGNLQITPEMMAQELKSVDDAFLVSLFPSLMPDKQDQKTVLATIEAANERGIFLAPTLGRQFTDYLGPMLDREADILQFLSANQPDNLRIMPKMPPVMREAGAESQTVFCSPLAKALTGQKVSGFMKVVQFAQGVAEATGDQEVMDVFDFDVANPAMADEFFVPVDWMADPKKIAAKRQARQKQVEQENAVKALPGQAAIEKAHAISDKAAAGQNIGGTLSGVPEGGMPMMPGQNAPGGRAFGQPGQQ